MNIQSNIFKMVGTGIYELKFDASKLSSGVYVYRLQAENYNDSRKMLLVK